MGIEKRCSSSFREGLAAFGAAIASSFVAVDLDVAAAGMTSGRAVPVGTEAPLRVHGGDGILGRQTTRDISDADPLCFV